MCVVGAIKFHHNPCSDDLAVSWGQYVGNSRSHKRNCDVLLIPDSAAFFHLCLRQLIISHYKFNSLWEKSERHDTMFQ
jgi:hypothetical protein